ncbi:MAG: RING-HC finger protein, partial [Endozoicomonas sp.]
MLCKEKCSDTVFLPCGHLTTCNTCASGITKCPVQTCDRKIDSLIK